MARMGRKKGHKVTAATRAKISVALRGRKNPEQSERVKRLWADPEYRAQMAASHRGQVPKHLKRLHRMQRGPTHPLWKGGVIIRRGYRFVWVDGKHVREHRLVMEQLLGRKLKRREV